MEGGNIEMADNVTVLLFIKSENTQFYGHIADLDKIGKVIFFIGIVHQLRRHVKEKMNQDVGIRKRYAEFEAKVNVKCLDLTPSITIYHNSLDSSTNSPV